MCLAIPGKVIEIFEKDNLKMGKIDFAGIKKEACLAFVPEINIGQYVLIHAGVALNIIDEEEAKKTYEAWNEVIDTVDKETKDE